MKTTKVVHRKSRRDRIWGVWKQFYQVKHGVVGIALVSIFFVMAFMAPILFPEYPGNLARVGPNYSAPSWLQFTDPDNPPAQNYNPDPHFSDESAWDITSIDTFTGQNDSHGSWEFDTTDYLSGSQSLKLTITDDSNTSYYRTSVSARITFLYEYSEPQWVTVSFDMKGTMNGTLTPGKIVPYAELVMPEDSPYPDYLGRVEIKSVLGGYSEDWDYHNRNMSILSRSTTFQPGEMVTLEIGLEFSNRWSNPLNPFPDPVEMGTAEFWFDNLKVTCVGDFYGVLGTTNKGQDVFAQLLWGAQVSLYVGLVATFFGVVFGLIVGLVSGYFGGAIDELLMRIVDLFLIMPTLPIMMILAALFTPSLEITIFIIAIFAWPGSSRVIRSQVLVEKEKAYVEAASAAGAGDIYLIYKHIFPNVLTLVFVQLATGVSGSILQEAALSFLALTPQNLVSWGRMLQEGHNAGALMNNAWWFVVPPGALICLMSMGFVFIGYAVDKAMNPKQRKL